MDYIISKLIKIHEKPLDEMTYKDIIHLGKYSPCTLHNDDKIIYCYGRWNYYSLVSDRKTGRQSIIYIIRHHNKSNRHRYKIEKELINESSLKNIKKLIKSYIERHKNEENTREIEYFTVTHIII